MVGTKMVGIFDTLEEAEAEHARGVQLFHRSLLGARTGDGEREEQGRTGARRP